MFTWLNTMNCVKQFSTHSSESGFADYLLKKIDLRNSANGQNIERLNGAFGLVVSCLIKESSN